MKKETPISLRHFRRITAILFLCPISLSSIQASAASDQSDVSSASVHQEQTSGILRAEKINPTTVDVLFANQQRMTIDFYGENIFRVFQDNSGGIIRDPEAKPEAQILVDQPRRKVSGLSVDEKDGYITLTTAQVRIELNKQTGLMKVFNPLTGKCVIEEVAPVIIGPKEVTVTIKEKPQEYIYGGRLQNGRYSQKGKVIAIENQNSWTAGGVASPAPFYWSTNGYGMMWYTFRKGEYDFGATEKNIVKLSHNSSYLDIFYMVNDGVVSLLNDFYQLTGNPVLLPKFGFYEGHLNAYNRDYWKEDEKGILFEDGKRYKESQKDNGGIKESLNGEKNNYQFSARAVIDRYKNHDMPLGWLLPNDGYGAGYGQTETLDGNIANLKSLGDYARKNGVEIGLWTQSDLHPKEGISALLQRDIVKEVRDAGVRVLKTDVAWVGAGYSFGLNGVADVGHIMPYYGNDARPFIISLDGWAGTQRYAGIWSGDQTGGEWEYIRFHIPTYIGSGLSGQPNICSDMDGIFGGKNAAVNIRDFQWKTFTPMQLNMDGWGANEKYPHALGEPATSINRMYLKLKSELMPYTYSFAREAVDGMPLIRAMFLDYPNEYTYGTATRYQYMYGTDFLVAPVYQNTKADKEGNDIRNGIYLPEGTWIDYFSGEKYEGNRILSNFDTPVWKLPVFVKNGAIIPMTQPNNNVSEIDPSLRIYEFYPNRHTATVEYDDDGVTEAYRQEKSVSTLIESNVDAKNRVTITIHPTAGSFDGFVKDKKYKIVGDDAEVDLTGTWKYKIGINQNEVMKYAGKLKNLKKAGSGLYNGMIHPISNYQVKGAIWYQGESNSGRSQTYASLLEALIQNWRELWKMPDMPFLLVQLPNYMEKSDKPSDSGWARIREAQFKTALNVPHTALAVTYDVGEWNDIHPLNKKAVAQRLFLGARRLVYGEKVTASGPLYKEMKVEGDKIILTFTETGRGLTCKGKELKHFAIAGEDRKFVWADAVIRGNKVVVSSELVKNPVAVRYAWSNNPEDANLCNKEGLLASPFRTDNW